MNRFEVFLRIFGMFMAITLSVVMDIGGIVAVIIAMCTGSLKLGVYGGMGIVGNLALVAAILAVSAS